MWDKFKFSFKFDSFKRFSVFLNRLTLKRLTPFQRRLFFISLGVLLLLTGIGVNLWFSLVRKQMEIVELTIPPDLPEAIKKRKDEEKKEALPRVSIVGVVVLRDPFSPHLVKPEEEQILRGPSFAGLNLTGIIWDEETPLAIINDEFLKRGEFIEGKEILEIQRDRIVIREGERKFILSLWSEK